MSTEAIGKDWLRLQSFLGRDMRHKARFQYTQFQTMLNALEPRVGPIKEKAILDIGCGKFYPFTLLFASLGNKVTGIDILYIGANESSLRKYCSILRCNGFRSLMEELLYKLSFKERAYYQALEEASGLPLTTERITFEQIGAENMGFPDETFDIVVSVATFEHLAKVPQAVSELSRIMKAGAIAYIDINLFASPSGGHHFNWLNTAKVPPWDHLRQRKLPFTVYLNEMREHEYLEVFRRELKILEVIDIDKGEGSELLTPEIRAELRDYAEEELTKYGIAIIAQKDKGNRAG